MANICDVSIDDSDALKLKVDEALSVYDEYVKQQGGSSEGEGEKKEEKKTES